MKITTKLAIATACAALAACGSNNNANNTDMNATDMNAGMTDMNATDMNAGMTGADNVTVAANNVTVVENAGTNATSNATTNNTM